MDQRILHDRMVYKGLADGMVSGAENTTANTIRPALQFIKTRPGINTVSSIFFMLLNDREPKLLVGYREKQNHSVIQGL